MRTTIIGSGSQENIEGQIDPSRQALRVSLQPNEFLINGVQGGHYYLNATTGAISAIAASGQIFAMRWNDPTKIFVLLRVTASAVCTAFSTGTGADLEAIRASSYTANGSGGTAITPSTLSQMSRTSAMPQSSFNGYGEIRISTTAALTPGTQTLDTAGFGACQIGSTGAGGGAGPLDLYNMVSMPQYPIILNNNQGFVVRAVTAVPSSNTFRYSVNVIWMEVAAY
jgi:hypothetical protein